MSKEKITITHDEFMKLSSEAIAELMGDAKKADAKDMGMHILLLGGMCVAKIAGKMFNDEASKDSEPVIKIGDEE